MCDVCPARTGADGGREGLQVWAYDGLLSEKGDGPVRPRADVAIVPLNYRFSALCGALHKAEKQAPGKIIRGSVIRPEQTVAFNANLVCNTTVTRR